jgi:hypothetical protein
MTPVFSSAQHAPPHRDLQGHFVRARLLAQLPTDSDTASVYFEHPVGATRFPDGTIAVADGLAPAIRFFDAQGAFLRSVGREGEGPGEFATLNWMGRCGTGTVTVWDFSLLRFTTVTATGEIRGQGRLEDIWEIPRPPAILSCSRAGHTALLLRLSGERIRGRDISVLTAPLYLVSSRGVATLIDEAAPVIEWINDERIYRPVSMTTQFAVSDSRLYVSRSDSAQIRIYDLNGHLEEVLTLDLVRRAPTDGHVRRNAEERTAFISDRAGRSRFVDRYMTLPRPAYLPYHNGIHLDAAGHLWVLLSFPGDPTTSLRAFTLRGDVIGDVLVPTDLRILELGDDYILGTIEDAATLEPRVVLYGFELPDRFVDRAGDLSG